MLKIFVKSVLERFVQFDDACYEKFIAELRSVLHVAEKLLCNVDKRKPKKGEHFSISMGVIPVLYLLATAVADNNIRERAMASLKSCNRREGLWDS